MDQPMHLKLDRTASDSVSAYIEYKRIVGDDDGGRTFSPEEFEKYKAKMIPLRTTNRLYVSWGPAELNLDCKLVGPETPCFCGHRYQQHLTDFEDVSVPEALRLKCQQAKCKCKHYSFTPSFAPNRPARCTCKHLPSDHSAAPPFKCENKTCSCSFFTCAHRCECGQESVKHATRIETRTMREARGQPVDNLAGGGLGYKALGGLTHFSSLADGKNRVYIDKSSMPVDCVSSLPSTSAPSEPDPLKGSLPPKPRKMTEEEEMAFYEKRYQQRIKAEKAAGGKKASYGIALNAPPLALLDEFQYGPFDNNMESKPKGKPMPSLPPPSSSSTSGPPPNSESTKIRVTPPTGSNKKPIPSTTTITRKTSHDPATSKTMKPASRPPQPKKPQMSEEEVQSLYSWGKGGSKLPEGETEPRMKESSQNKKEWISDF